MTPPRRGLHGTGPQWADGECLKLRPGVFVTIDGHAALLLGDPDETLGGALDGALGQRRGWFRRRAWPLHDATARRVPETTKLSELPDDVRLFTHTRYS